MKPTKHIQIGGHLPSQGLCQILGIEGGKKEAKKERTVLIAVGDRNGIKLV